MLRLCARCRCAKALAGAPTALAADESDDVHTPRSQGGTPGRIGTPGRDFVPEHGGAGATYDPSEYAENTGEAPPQKPAVNGHSRTKGSGSGSKEASPSPGAPGGSAQLLVLGGALTNQGVTEEEIRKSPPPKMEEADDAAATMEAAEQEQQQHQKMSADDGGSSMLTTGPALEPKVEHLKSPPDILRLDAQDVPRCSRIANVERPVADDSSAASHPPSDGVPSPGTASSVGIGLAEGSVLPSEHIAPARIYSVAC